jgi:NAD(P)-dependent dehydrogenase (short-subunit alcohol dehydrogenase family)
LTLNYGALLNGRRALIAGGAPEIGHAVASLFSEHGATVDVADTEEKAAHIICEMSAVHGPIDIFVSIMGAYGADFKRMLDMNVLSAIRLTKLLIPGMRKNARGDIVHIIADVGSFRARESTAAIAACSGAIGAFSRCVTMDYIRYRVRSNCVTYPMDGLPRRKSLLNEPSPEDAANAALWYACDLSRFVIGNTLQADGGQVYITGGGATA